MSARGNRLRGRGAPGGPPGGRAGRTARLELLRALAEDGFSLEELRQATAEGRLALVPVERVLAAEEPRYTQEDSQRATGLELDFLAEARRAVGAPASTRTSAVLTEDDLELAQGARRCSHAGLSREQFLELTRLMSQAMANVAAGLTSIFGEALLRPGTPSATWGCATRSRCATWARWRPRRSAHAQPAHARGDSPRGRRRGRAAQRPAARRPAGHGRVRRHRGLHAAGRGDPARGAGRAGARLRALRRARASPPVRLVKTIGDAAMLVAPTPKPVLDAVVGLVEDSAEAEGCPLLRGGVASRRGAPARRRLVRAAGEPRLAAHLVRPARQRRGIQGRPRRRAGRLRLVVRGQPPLQGGGRRGAPCTACGGPRRRRAADQS